MGYYRGDYYRGDYYRGDPGFLSFLGGAAKAIGGFIPGVGPIIEAGGALVRQLGKPSTAIIKAPGAVSGALPELKGGWVKKSSSDRPRPPRPARPRAAHCT